MFAVRRLNRRHAAHGKAWLQESELNLKIAFNLYPV